ncbi:MAG: hypothetical protein J5752_03575, partial [Clostridiales bacterium]|nr:hypothetical protein [Clostridiales bacterium]
MAKRLLVLFPLPSITINPESILAQMICYLNIVFFLRQVAFFFLQKTRKRMASAFGVVLYAT